MAAEILSATMVVSREPLRKKGMRYQWTSTTPRGGMSGVVNKVIYTSAHSKPSNPEGHKFISFIITVTSLPSLNRGVTLPYLSPTLSYSFEGKGTLSYIFPGKIVSLQQTNYPSLSEPLE